MWKDLDRPWQEAFSYAWEAYKNNTIPVGAIIVDESQNTIAVGRNMIFDQTSSNCLAGTCMAHAEMTAMMQLKEVEHPNIRSYTLFTTLEPCPMCFGTMLMMHICNLKYAAKDGFGGGTELKDKIEYTKNKTMVIEKGDQELEAFQMALQSAFEYERQHRRMEEIFGKWSEYCAEGVQLGIELFEENYFNQAIEQGTDLSTIYDFVVSRYKEKLTGDQQSLVG